MVSPVCARPESIKNIKSRQRERENGRIKRCSLRSERAEKKVINYFYTFFHLSLTGVRNKLRWKVKSFLPLSFLCWLPHNDGAGSAPRSKLTPKKKRLSIKHGHFSQHISELKRLKPTMFRQTAQTERTSLWGAKLQNFNGFIYI